MPVTDLIFYRHAGDRKYVRIKSGPASWSKTLIAGSNTFDVTPTES